MKRYLLAAASVAVGLALAAPSFAQSGTSPAPGVAPSGGMSGTGGAAGNTRGSAPVGSAMSQGGMERSTMAAPSRKKARKAKKSRRSM